MAARLPGKKRKLKEQEKLFEEVQEKKNKKQVCVLLIFCAVVEPLILSWAIDTLS